MYVDEHAFTVQVLSHANIGASDPDAFIQDGNDDDSHAEGDISSSTRINPLHWSAEQLCQRTLSLGASICKVHAAHGRAGPEESLVEIVLDAVTKPRSEEVTVIPLAYLPSRASPSGSGGGSERGSGRTNTSSGIDSKASTSRSAAFDLTLRLTTVVCHSAWVSRRVVLLLVPVQCDEHECGHADSTISSAGARHSKALQRWITRYFSSGSSSSAGYRGVLREALVVDVTSVRRIVGQGNVLGRRKRERRTGEPPHFTGFYALHVAGAGGSLPNMDMVSATLTLLPAPAVTAYAGVPLPTWMQSILRQVVHVTHVQRHLQTLQGLLCFWTAQLAGPDGLHGAFLASDVDAITLKTDSSTVDLDELQEMMSLMIRAFSQLHEELHHSHFFYYLMDGGTKFVGLGEQVLPLVLVLATLLLLFQRYACRAGHGHGQENEQLLLAVYEVAIDIAPMGLLLLSPPQWLHTLADRARIAPAICAVSACSLLRIACTWWATTVDADGKTSAEPAHLVYSDQRCTRSAYSTVLIGFVFVVCMHAGGHMHALAHPLSLLSAAVLWAVHWSEEEGASGSEVASSSEESPAAPAAPAAPAQVSLYLVALALAISPLLVLTFPPALVQLWTQDFCTVGMGSGELSYVIAVLHALSVAALRAALIL